MRGSNWKCPGCGQYNYRENDACGNCRTPAPTPQEAADIYVDYERDPNTGEVFTVQKGVAAEVPAEETSDADS